MPSSRQLVKDVASSALPLQTWLMCLPGAARPFTLRQGLGTLKSPHTKF